MAVDFRVEMGLELGRAVRGGVVALLGACWRLLPGPGRHLGILPNCTKRAVTGSDTQ